MTFEFGMIAELDPEPCMWSMLAIVGFILTFDFFIGFMEFFLEDSPLYNRMVQTIYKELMQMGIISLIVVLYEALASPEELEQSHELVLCMEFSHIVLFFLAIFLVVHAFFLMGVSIMASKEYVRFNNRSLSSLLEEYKSSSKFKKLSFKYSPLSSMREVVEFKILHGLFRDTYCHIPRAFDFSMYLQKCQQKYALRTAEVSIYSWLLVVLIVVANFFRAQYNGPLSCGEHSVLILHDILGNFDDDPTEQHASRRFLATDDHHLQDDHSSATDDHSSAADDHSSATDDHSAGVDDGHAVHVPTVCYYQYIYLFCISSFVVTVVMALLLILSRVYMRRLIQRAGISSPSEYIDFIEYCEADKAKYEEYKRKRESKGLPVEEETFRMTNADTKKAICQYFDDNEKGDEESRLYMTITEAFVYTWETCFLSLKLLFATMQGKSNLTEAQQLHHSHGGEILGHESEDPSKEGSGSSKPSAVAPEGADSGNGQPAEIFIGRSARSQTIFNKTMNSMKSSQLPPTSPKRDERSDSLPPIKEISTRSRGGSKENADSVPNRPRTLSENHTTDHGRKSHALSEQEKQDLGLSDPLSSPRRPNREQSGRFSWVVVKPGDDTKGGSPPIATDKLRQEQADHELYQGTTVLSRYIRQKYQRKAITETTGVEPVHAVWSLKSSNSVAPAQIGILSDNFDDVFLFGSRNLFYRSVEMTIMVVSLYMAMWITNFISVVGQHSSNPIKFQVFMVAPIILCFWMVGQLAKVCSIIDGITNIDEHLSTISEVIDDTMDQQILLDELRVKILRKIEHLSNPHVGLCEIFYAVDIDHSGSIDKLEFRGMLRRLKLRYSDQRFKRLFGALDVDGNNCINLDDFSQLIFPELARGQLDGLLDSISDVDEVPPPINEEATIKDVSSAIVGELGSVGALKDTQDPADTEGNGVELQCPEPVAKLTIHTDV